MKFIRITTHTEEFYKAKPENFKALLEEHKRWLEEKKRAGKLLDAFLLAGNADGDRSITLWEFDSPEEIDECIWEDPIGFTFVWEVYPAVDVFAHIEHVLPHL